MTENPTVFIICGVHNQLDYTKRLFGCLEKQTYQNIQIIIIDDGSTDGTANYINKYYPSAILLQGDGNLWWTGAIYLGVASILEKAKKGDYILILNNDCTFDDNYIKLLLKASKENSSAIVGSLIVIANNRNRIWDGGVKIDWSRGKYIQLGPKNISDIPVNVIYQNNIDTISTKGTLYPIEIFRKIGNFDKKHLPHYISDYEFACRAKRKGFRLIISYQARIYNDVSRTGFGEKLSGRISLREFWVLLFSRKSRLNIIDQFWFIRLSCPPRFKLQNYLLIIAKFFYISSYIYPLNLIRNVFNKNE